MMKMRGTRLPSYDELMAAASVVARRAETGSEGGDVALAGGLAMQVWGSPRLTADLDVVADSRLGYAGEPLLIGGVRTREGRVPLDVIVRADEWSELYVAALMASVEVEDVPMRVVTPEYLAAMKMVAGRDKDHADLRYLVLSEDYDVRVAEAIVRQHLGAFAVKELRSLTAEAEWLKSRGG